MALNRIFCTTHSQVPTRCRWASRWSRCPDGEIWRKAGSGRCALGCPSDYHPSLCWMGTFNHGRMAMGSLR